MDDVAALLQETLNEEKNADKKLSEIADKVIPEAEGFEKPEEVARGTRSRH